MSEANIISTTAGGMKAKLASGRIQSFEKRFGKLHLYFACHAAFPMALTPDLLYSLWINFKQDIHGHSLDIPRDAVADLLLSTLCDEVGYELYEMDVTVRNELLSLLKEDENFGQERIKELSDFLLSYIQQHFYSDDLDIQDFAEAQWFTALAYTRPNRAAHELASTFSRLNQKDTAELVRMASLVEALKQPLAEKFNPLLIYARAMASFARGNSDEATTQLGEVVEQGNRIRIAGVSLPIPEQIEANLDALRSDRKIDYRRVNLRGRSFKGQDLTGADFSYANIRGADFTNATLVGANFSHAIAGLQRRWAAVLILCSLLLSALSGFSSIIIGFALSTSLFNLGNETIYFFSIASLIMFLFFCVVIIRQGIEATIGAVALALPGILTVVLAVVAALAGAWGWAVGVPLALPGILAVVAAGAGARAGTFGFAGVWTGLWVVGSALILTLTIGVPGIILVFSGTAAVAAANPSLTWAMGILMPMAVPLVGLVVVGVALTVALALALAGTVSAAWALTVGLLLVLVWFLALVLTWVAGVGVIVTAMVGIVPGLGAYIGWRTLAGDDKYAFVWTAAMLFIAMGGTRFQGANLTDADFTQATLKSAVFRKANLTRTCWFRGKKLHLADIGESYLKYPQVRQLVITRVGEGKNFNRLKLRGVNLCGANLADASFIGTDLSESNLQDAYLLGAKLVQTQLDQTDLAGACLTGACIQDWNITNSTKIDGVECEYFYMRLPTRANPDPCRQPEDSYEIFEPGDFADFIQL